MTKQSNLALVKPSDDPFQEVERLSNLISRNIADAEAEERNATTAHDHTIYLAAQVAKYKAEAVLTTGSRWATALSRQRAAEDELAQYNKTAEEAEQRAANCRSVAEGFERQLEALRGTLQQTVTRDDVVAFCRDYCRDRMNARKFVYKVFAAYGATSINDAKVEDYPSIIWDIQRGPIPKDEAGSAPEE